MNELRKLLPEATPGPWKQSGTAKKPHWYIASPDVLVHGPALVREWDTVQQTVDRWTADAALIVYLRNHAEDIATLIESAQRCEYLLGFSSDGASLSMRDEVRAALAPFGGEG